MSQLIRYVSAAELAKLEARVAELETRPASSRTWNDAPTSVPSVQLSAVEVRVKGTRYKLSAVATASDDIVLGFVQIAVEGAKTDVGQLRGVQLKAGVPVRVEGEGFGPGTYRAFLTYSQDSAFWMTGPRTVFTVVDSKTPVTQRSLVSQAAGQ